MRGFLTFILFIFLFSFGENTISFIIASIASIYFYIKFGIWFPGEKKCAWCNSGKIQFKNGKSGKKYWKYRNKDGSPDKRVKDNYEQASFTSVYLCPECEAKTEFKHFVDKQPSENAGIWKRNLLSDGKGEKKGYDWEDTKASTVKTTGEHRKGDEE